MKVSQSTSLLLATVASTSAFAPGPMRPMSTLPTLSMAEESAEVSDVVTGSAMPSADPYERIGIKEEEMALGIDATEFLQWIGT